MENTAINFDTYIYRKALVGDIEQLLPLYESLFSQESDFEYNPQRQRDALKLLLESDTSVVYIADYAGEVVAMCTMQTYISTAAGGAAGIIEDVVVSQRFRGLGIGTKLLSHCESFAKARGLKRLHLLMDKNNELALMFYTKNEWRSTDLMCLQKFCED